MLYTPESHEPLAGQPWEEKRARAAIREIAADCENSFAASWPMHPLDAESDDDGPYATVYIGSAGVIHALSLLAERGLTVDGRDWVPVLERALEGYRSTPEFEEWAHPPSFWMGETGILLALNRLVPSTEHATRIAELVEANIDDTRREFMWGTPGTMLAARAIDRPDLWRASAESLRAARDEDGLWTQRIYGQELRFLGPAHGFAGCVVALAHEPGDDLHRRASDTFKELAIEEDGLATWPPVEGSELVQRDGTMRLQWCHGAPGMVASLAGIAPGDDEHERLLLAGGELTWLAGPLVKGANLCHGTAGSGLAFLKLFERTGDELWLERARAFAMHAIAQVERAHRELGRGRYSLWTGDPGTALYLALCLDGAASVPTFDAPGF
jgi:hypothetical protein